MTEQSYYVSGMDCAECANTVQKGISRLDGVAAVRVNFATGKLQLQGNVSEEVVRGRLEALGYGLHDNLTTQDIPALRGNNSATRFFHYLLLCYNTFFLIPTNHYNVGS